MRARTLCLTLAGLAALAGPAAALAQERSVPLEARRALALTVYQNDLALVEETRWVALLPGENRLALEGIGDGLIPESLVVGTPAAGARLLAQSYQPATLTRQALLEAAVGQRVRLLRENPETGEERSEDAVLLSMAQGPILQVGDRIEIDPPGRIVLAEVPDTLHPRPVVRLALDSAESGPGELRLTYLTQGLGWQADYVARFDAAAGRLDLTARVSLDNRSGTPYEDATLRLVAGSVTRASEKRRPEPVLEMRAAAMAAESASPPEPQAAAGRYLYETGRRVDLAAGESQQITLFAADGLPAERLYRLEGLASAGGPQETQAVPAQLLLAFANPAEGAGGGPGRPMPAGLLRAYEVAGDGPALFAGEARIGHTPPGETLEVALGEAFAVTARSRMTAYERLSERSFESAQEIVVANAGEQAVAVEVVGAMPAGWQMLEQSAEPRLRTANRPVWTLRVPAGGSTTLTYRVRVAR